MNVPFDGSHAALWELLGFAALIIMGRKKKKAAPLVDRAGNIELLDSGKGHEGKITAAALSVNIRQESWEDIRFI